MIPFEGRYRGRGKKAESKMMRFRYHRPVPNSMWTTRYFTEPCFNEAIEDDAFILVELVLIVLLQILGITNYDAMARVQEERGELEIYCHHISRALHFSCVYTTSTHSCGYVPFVIVIPSSCTDDSLHALAVLLRQSKN